MQLTYENIMAGSTSTGNGTGAWNAKQLAILEIKWPPKRGWLKQKIGKSLSDEKYSEFLGLKGRTKGKKKNRPALKIFPKPRIVTDSGIDIQIFREAMRGAGINLDGIEDNILVLCFDAAARKLW